jgi:hypothetical protein
MGSIIAEYDVKKDERNRVTLKGGKFDYYRAKLFDDGHIEFYPQVLTDASVSLRTLTMMDSAMENFSRGATGATLDPRDILDTGEEEK